MKRRTIYLASPYGFSPHWRLKLLPDLIQALESLQGVEVWEPFARNAQMDFSQPGTAWRVARADLSDVKKSDAIFAIVNGTPPDEGVMVELGAAIAWRKKIFLYRDDFRRCSDSPDYPLNLMLFSGLPYDGWQDYFYTSIDDIGNPGKAICQWLHSEIS